MPACAKCGYDPDAPVLASWSFLVERDPPSLNDRLFNTGPRAFLYRRERDTWCWELRAIRLLRRMPRAMGRRRVTLVRVFSGRQRERDRDNLVGGMKTVVDALVLEGMLVSDDPAGVELHYGQEHGQPTGLRITIEVLA